MLMKGVSSCCCVTILLLAESCSKRQARGFQMFSLLAYPDEAHSSYFRPLSSHGFATDTTLGARVMMMAYHLPSAAVTPASSDIIIVLQPTFNWEVIVKTKSNTVPFMHPLNIFILLLPLHTPSLPSRAREAITINSGAT